METARRRAFLEAMAEKAETDGARLKALDLLERLDAPEEASRRPEPPDFQYDDEWLARTAALFLGLGFAAPPIEERAQEIAAVATRERFAVLDAHAQGRSFRGRPATRRPHHARPPRLRAHAGAGRSARGVATRLGALFVLCGLAG